MENSFANKHPELVSEWSEKNLPLTANMVTYGSNKVMWWKGTCGHEWQTSIKARSSGEGCPICSGVRVVEGVNDLATLRPELAREWTINQELKPTMVTVGSNKKVLWKGKCGHRWIASVKSRAVNKTNCPYCSHNAVLEGFNDLASQKPEIVQEWSKKNEPLMPQMVTVFANKKVWWKCKRCGNEWNTLISTRSGGSKCPYCSGLILKQGFNDLQTTHPELVSEWSERNLPLTADKINAKSRKNVWWVCTKCGNEWKSVIHSRVQGRCCPVCADKEILAGYNDLATTNPELLKEWDYEKNKILPTEISRYSMKIVWWRCSEGHSWRGKITDRTVGNVGCKVCEQEYLSILPKLLVMFYTKREKLSLMINEEREIGIPLELYIPEEKIAIETCIGTDKMERLKEYLCSKREIRLIKLPYKIGMNEAIYAAQVKKAFRSAYVFIDSDEEEDVRHIRNLFFEWRKSKKGGNL